MNAMPGIDIGATFTRAVLLDETLVPLGRWRTPEPARVETLFDEIRRRCGGACFDRFGLALAPSLDLQRRVRQWPNRPEFAGVPLIALAETVFRARAITLDDGAAAAVAEHVAAADEPHTTTAFLGIGSGIASGVVIDDRLHLGATGSAFSIAHVSSTYAGQTSCPCGRRGCLQTIASGRVLARVAKAHDAATRADAGEASARAAVAGLIDPLAEACALVERWLDPHRIVIGGGAASAFLVERLRAHCDRVKPSHYDEFAGAAGAAMVARLGLDARLFGAATLTGAAA